MAKNLSGGTTVAGTMMIAHKVCKWFKLKRFVSVQQDYFNRLEFQFLSLVELVVCIEQVKLLWMSRLT